MWGHGRYDLRKLVYFLFNMSGGPSLSALAGIVIVKSKGVIFCIKKVFNIIKTDFQHLSQPQIGGNQQRKKHKVP